MTSQVRAKLGAARAEVSYLIKKELGDKGYTLTAVADEMGLSHEAVCKVVRGQGHSKPVLAKLRELGVSEKYLHDPRQSRKSTTAKTA